MSVRHPNKISSTWRTNTHNNNSSSPPMNTLGPFAVLRCNNIKLIIKHQKGCYDAIVLSNGHAFEGKISVKSDITLSEDAKQQAKIPMSAVAFVMAYPSKSIVGHILSSPEEYFEFYGGYVYVDGYNDVVGVNAIGPNGNDISFEGPFYADVQKEISLQHAQRFQPVTLPNLLKQKITHYCWLLPYEKDNFGNVMCTHGGFMYKTGNFVFYFTIKDTSVIAWERKEGPAWISFSASVLKQLEKDYTHASELTEIDQSKFDFGKMQQICKEGTFSIRRVYCENSNPLWHCYFKKNWHPYDKIASQDIERAFLRALAGGDVVYDVNSEYSIDFNDMQQMNKLSGFRRPVKRISTVETSFQRMPIGRRMNLLRGITQTTVYGELAIMIKEAKNLPSLNRLFSCSPFIIVTTNFSDFLYKTETISRQTDPKWNEGCKISRIKTTEPGNIIFTVHHQHSLGKISYLARMIIPVSEIISAGESGIEGWRSVNYESKAIVQNEKKPMLNISIVFREKPYVNERKELGLGSILSDEILDKHRPTSQILKMPINRVETIADGIIVGKFGKYAKKDILGEGSYGKVYLCEKLNTDEKVALKIIPKVIDNIELEDSFIKLEIQILHLLSSEFCVSVIESMETPDSIYIIMEFCSGGNLFDLLQNLKAQHFVDIARDLLSAVAYLHQIGICHRDIKPDNIFYDKTSNKWKLADFGVSTFFVPGQLIEGKIGSIHYMAPEVFTSIVYSEAVDIWSAGVTMFVVISYRYPWLSTGELEIIEEIIANAVVWGPEWDNLREAKDFVSKLMYYEVDQRPTAQKAFGHRYLQTII